MPKMYGDTKEECGKDSPVVHREPPWGMERYDTKAYGGREEVEYHTRFCLMLPNKQYISHRHVYLTAK